MRFIFTVFFFLIPSLGLAKVSSFYDLSASDISGKTVSFSTFRGKVVLIVNTASQCGFTPQLKDLQEIYLKYSPQGFVVLGFPSNDFRQETAVAADIQKFASKEYGITFPLFEKGSVTGKNKQPVFEFLTEAKSGFLFKEVSWNFEKFLVNRKGQVVERWSSVTRPNSDDIIKAVEKELK